MKKLVMSLTLVFFGLSLIPAMAGGEGGKKYNFHGTPADRAAVENLLDESLVPAEVKAGKTIIELKGKFKIDKSKPVEEAAVDFIDRHRHAFGLKDPKKELKLRKKNEYKEGDTHIHYQQTYNGIPIWQKIVNVHLDNNKDIDRISSGNVPTPDIDTTPLVSEEEAVEIAKRDLLNSPAASADWVPPKSELIILPNGSIMRLVYLVKLNTRLGLWYYYIDAKTGGIAKKANETRFPD